MILDGDTGAEYHTLVITPAISITSIDCEKCQVNHGYSLFIGFLFWWFTIDLLWENEKEPNNES